VVRGVLEGHTVSICIYLKMEAVGNMKVKLCLYLFKPQTKRTQGSGGIIPYILNISTRWYPLDRKLGELQSQSGCC
jgi:hypothetical protein